MQDKYNGELEKQEGFLEMLRHPSTADLLLYYSKQLLTPPTTRALLAALGINCRNKCSNTF